MIPQHDEVHISCCLTWNKRYAEDLAYQWEGQTNKPVRLGGPTFGTPVEGFQQGMYVRKNVIFTTRGCNNNCPWCIVPKLEGKISELPVVQGNILQDNNFLQANQTHKNRVFDMLRTQKGVCFKGGLQSSLVNDRFIDAIQSLYYTRGDRKISRIAELWLACDTDEALPTFKRACEKLVKIGFTRAKIRCFALIGDDMDKNEARLREIYETGAGPFAQLQQDFSETKKEYSFEWKTFARMWQRPAAFESHMKHGTDFRDYHT
jgi:hypothetical protein